jgi:hypothetical protein
MHKESPLNFEKKKELGFSFLFFLQFFLFLAFKKNSAAKERTASRRNSLSLSLSPSLSCCFLALGSFFYTAYSLACFIVFPLFQKRRFLNVVAAGLTVLRVTDNVSVLLVTEYFIFYFVYSQN